MSQDSITKLESTECHNINYNTTRNKKMVKERLGLNKHCSKCKKHTLHKETK